MTKKIIFTTGGTGGHILPAINLMKHFYERGYAVLLVTDQRGKNFVRNFSEFQTYVLRADSPTNKIFYKKILSLLIIIFSIFKSILILKKEKPDLIFGMGGYVSFPLSFASKFFKLPLIIYENNMILGRANKFLSSLSKKILVAKKSSENFPKKYKNKTFEVGTILSKNIINYSISPRKKNDENSFSILVLGGSQGAEIFGDIVPTVIKMINNKGYKVKIVQQCVASQKDIIKNFYDKNNINNSVFEFDKDVLSLILDSNLAITRGGASTTAELTYTLTPFIAVPLPDSIDNHQYLNAKYYENNGCCWILEQKNFNIEKLFNLIMEFLKNKNKLNIVRENMKKNHKQNVYKNIENEIREFI